MEEVLIPFFEHFKKNALLCAIVINGSFNGLDLTNKNSIKWSEKAIQLNDIKFGNSTFDAVHVAIIDSVVYIDFKTTDSVFHEMPQEYFGRQSPFEFGASRDFDDDFLEEQFVDLGIYEMGFLNSISTIKLKKSKGNYWINLRLYPSNYSKRRLSKNEYFIFNTRVRSDFLFMLDYKDFHLSLNYSPYKYSARVDIELTNSNHPIAEYFRNKSLLLYDDKIYEHGNLPIMRPHEVCNMEYQEKGFSIGSKKVDNILILEQCPNEMLFEEVTGSYDVKSPELKFFDVDGKVYSKIDLEKSEIDLKTGYELVRVLFGKEACDIYLKTQYAQGIAVYKSN